MIQECRKFIFSIVPTAVLCGLLLVSTSCSHSKDAYLTRGEEFLQKRKFHEAVMQFRSAADVDKSSAPAHWGLARAYENLGQFNETLDELRKTIELAPDNLEAKVKLGNYYLLTQPPMISDAEKVLDEIFARDPNYIEARVLKASILTAKNKPEAEILDVLNQAIALDPQRTDSYLSKARYFMTVAKAAEAEDAIKKGIAANSSAPNGYIEYGRFLTYTNRFAEAETQFKQAAAVAPANLEAREAIAEFYVAQKQFDKAEQTYKDLVQIQENSPESRLDLANFYANTGRGDDAVKVLTGILTDAPEYARARYRLGELYLDRRENEKVGEQVDELLKINNNDADALMLRARVRLQQNKAEDAVKDLEEILKKKPTQRDALFYMTQARLALGQTDQARAFIGDLDKYHPKYLKTSLLKIQTAFTAGESESALRQSHDLVEAVKNTFPNADFDSRGLQELMIKAQTAHGLANLELGKIADAKTDLQEVLKISPNSSSAFVNLAKVAAAEKNSFAALDYYKKALNADQNNFDALSGIVSVNLKQNQSAAAQTEVDRAIGQNQGKNDVLAALHYLKADVCRADKNQTAQEDELKQAIALDEEYLPAYSAYAELLIEQNKTDGAVEQYRRIIAKKPSASVYTLLGIVEDARGNQSEAEINYRKALEIQPELPIAANNLAWIIAENGGNLDEALQLAQKSVNQNPNAAEYFDTLGWIYYKKGLYIPAVEHVKKAVALDESAAKKNGTAPNAEYRERLGKITVASNTKGANGGEIQTSMPKSKNFGLNPLPNDGRN